MVGEVLFSGNQHAEALMGALVKYADLLANHGFPPKLVSILQVRTCVNSTYLHASECATIGDG